MKDTDDVDTVDGKPVTEDELLEDYDNIAREAEVKDKEPEKVEPEWDKTRQQLDQMKAAQKRLSGERDTLSMQISSQNAEIDRLRQEIKVNQARKVEIKDLDPNSADVPEIVNQNKALIAELTASKERLARLENLAERLQAQERATEEQRRREQVAEEVLVELDEEFGAKYRAKAKKMADELVDSGEVPQPTSQMQAYKLVRKCYQEVSKSEKKPVKKVSTDNGAGSVSVPSTEDIKEGSRQEVLAQLRKKYKT